MQSEYILASYYEILQRTDKDHMIGVLHFSSATHYCLYGNAVGSSRDEVDIGNYVLKIRTNTAPIYFQFPDMDTMMNVVRLRAILRIVPLSLLSFGQGNSHHKSVMNALFTFICGNTSRPEDYTSFRIRNNILS